MNSVQLSIQRGQETGVAVTVPLTGTTFNRLSQFFSFSLSYLIISDFKP